MIFNETPRRQMVSKLVTWGHWFALCNIIVAICIAGIYLFSSSPPETPLGSLYLVANWLSHIGFLTFFGFVILVLPFCYLIPNSSFLRFWSSAVAAIGLAFLAFDALLYTRHGLHFSPYSTEFIKQQTNSVLAGLEVHQIVFLSISFVIWLLFQLLVANSLWHRVERLQRMKLGLPISATFICLFTFSHISHIWADANLYQPIVRQDNMFPLSYPATAKTLLSKHGLMDLDEYNTKKNLQFDNHFSDVTYPKSSLFCSVNVKQKNLLVFVDGDFTLTEGSSDMQALVAQAGLVPLNRHFDLSSNAEAGIKTALYGLPELLHKHLHSKPPILIELMSANPAMLTSYSKDEKISKFLTTLNTRHIKDFSALMNHIDNRDSGLFILHVSAEELLSVIAASNRDTQLFITALKSDSQVQTWSNITFNSNNAISSHQDIAPTLLNLMGCHIPDNQHSTGQNLFQQNRGWLVSYNEDKILMLHNGIRTEIAPDGSYQIFDYEGNNQNNAELNIPLLGQAVKLLSSFSD